MKIRTQRHLRARHAALVSAVSLACGGAFAQEAPANKAPPAGAEAENIEDTIVVTGTSIRGVAPIGSNLVIRRRRRAREDGGDQPVDSRQHDPGADAPTARWRRVRISGRSIRRRFTSSADRHRTPRWWSSTACARPAAARSSTRPTRTSFRPRPCSASTCWPTAHPRYTAPTPWRVSSTSSRGGPTKVCRSIRHTAPPTAMTPGI